MNFYGTPGMNPPFQSHSIQPYNSQNPDNKNDKRKTSNDATAKSNTINHQDILVKDLSKLLLNGNNYDVIFKVHRDTEESIIAAERAEHKNFNDSLDNFEGLEPLLSPNSPKLFGQESKNSDTSAKNSNSKEFKAHRVILASRSEYFRALLYSNFRENSIQNKDKTINIYDINEISTFQNILDYCYTGNIDLSNYDAHYIIEIICTAHRFGIDELVYSLIYYLLEPEEIATYTCLLNLFLYLQLDVNLDESGPVIVNSSDITMRENTAATTDSKLQTALDKIFIFLDNNAQLLLDTTDIFNSLTANALDKLLSRSSFYAKEIQIFNSVVKWRKANCLSPNNRGISVTEEEFNKILEKNIRFELMEEEEIFYQIRRERIVDPDILLDSLENKRSNIIANTNGSRGACIPNVDLATEEMQAEGICGECVGRLIKKTPNHGHNYGNQVGISHHNSNPNNNNQTWASTWNPNPNPIWNPNGVATPNGIIGGPGPLGRDQNLPPEMQSVNRDLQNSQMRTNNSIYTADFVNRHQAMGISSRVGHNNRGGSLHDLALNPNRGHRQSQYGGVRNPTEISSHLSCARHKIENDDRDSVISGMSRSSNTVIGAPSGTTINSRHGSVVGLNPSNSNSSLVQQQQTGQLVPQMQNSLQGINSLGNLNPSILSSTTSLIDSTHGHTNDKCLIIKLGKPSFVNIIKLKLWVDDQNSNEWNSYSYKINYSIDGKKYLPLLNYEDYICMSDQTLYVKPTVIHYLQIIGTRSEIHHHHSREGQPYFSVARLEVYFDPALIFQSSINNIIIPTKTNIIQIRGVSQDTTALFKSNLPYDWEKGYTCHQISGKECIVLAFNQPYMLNSFRLRLWDLDTRSYSYNVEVSIDNEHWELVANRTEMLTSRMPTGYNNHNSEVDNNNQISETEHSIIDEDDNSMTNIPNQPVNNNDRDNMTDDGQPELGEISPGQVNPPANIRDPMALPPNQDTMTQSTRRGLPSTQNDSSNQMIIERRLVLCTSWQTIHFEQRPVCFVKITGTRNTVNEVFHLVYFEAPAANASRGPAGMENNTNTSNNNVLAWNNPNLPDSTTSSMLNGNVNVNNQMERTNIRNPAGTGATDQLNLETVLIHDRSVEENVEIHHNKMPLDVDSLTTEQKVRLGLEKTLYKFTKMQNIKLPSTPSNEIIIFIPFTAPDKSAAKEIEDHLEKLIVQADEEQKILKIVKLKKNLFNLGQEYFDSFDFDQKNKNLFELEVIAPTRKRARGRNNSDFDASQNQQNHQRQRTIQPIIETFNPTEATSLPSFTTDPYFVNCHPTAHPTIAPPTYYGSQFYQPILPYPTQNLVHGQVSMSQVYYENKIQQPEYYNSTVQSVLVSNGRNSELDATVKTEKTKTDEVIKSDPAEKNKNDTNQVPIKNSQKIVYVNPKQYKRILKRRAQRARLVEKGLLPKVFVRKKYLHESRHRHAVMRNRSDGGRFNVGETKIKLQALKNLEEKSNNNNLKIELEAEKNLTATSPNNRRVMVKFAKDKI